MSERFSQVELMKQSQSHYGHGRKNSASPPSDEKNATLQTQRYIDKNSHQHIGNLSLDGAGRETIMGGGLLSGSARHGHTLSGKARQFSQVNVDDLMANAQPDSVEEQQLMASAAASREAFGPKKSYRSLERESNALANASPALRSGLNNMSPTSRNELYDAIEEESNHGRDTAEKNKVRSLAKSPDSARINNTPIEGPLKNVSSPSDPRQPQNSMH